MADEQQELRRVNWTEVFSFTHIFKTFRMAIHPSKLLLALAAIILIVLVGMGLDGLWRLGGGTAYENEPFQHFRNPVGFDEALERQQDDRQTGFAALYTATYLNQVLDPAGGVSFLDVYRVQDGKLDSAFGKKLDEKIADARKKMETKAVDADLAKKIKEDPGEYLAEHEKRAKDMLKDIASAIGDAADSADVDSEAPDYVAAKRALWMTYNTLIDEARYNLLGRGISRTLWDYETFCFGNAITAARRGNFFTGFSVLSNARNAPPSSVVAPAAPFGARAVQNDPEDVGFFPWLLMMAWGLIWLVCAHWLYAITYLLIALAIWAVFGGAIARMAALHAAREEKISISQAIRFSLSKFFSFFTAPLIPLALILVIGLLMGLGGLLMAVYVGDIIMAILFVLALVGGALIAFMTIGLVAGSPLMYPTIAVEGSDSFDAISRSFSYAFMRPWRYGLYTVVASVYGAVCYLFVRLFAFLVLLATHVFVGRGFFGLGTNSNSEAVIGPGAGKLDLLWTRPTFDQLYQPINSAAMGGYGWLVSGIIHLWVMLVVGLVVAFVLTFATSAQTVIYYLLRRKVDATDLDDVYVEEPEEEEVEPVGDEGDEGAEAEAGEAPEAAPPEKAEAEEPTEEPKPEPKEEGEGEEGEEDGEEEKPAE